VEGIARLLSRYNFAGDTSMVPAGCGDLFKKDLANVAAFAWGCLCSLHEHKC
jgi:hypothetical protein